MTGREAARRSRALDAVRQLLVRASLDARSFGDNLAAPSATDDDAARLRRELLARLARGIAVGVADALEAINAMADALDEPRRVSDEDRDADDRSDA